jgi:Zn-dependent protease
VAIAAVVLVHELGHWAAMRAFGWRNVQLVLLPLLGGVATGVEQRASARQRVWVTLAGPLPGIVLALAALYGLGPALMRDFVDSGETSWPMLAISVTLLLNYLNLLPFPPLDGGQLLRNLWPQRWRGGEWLLLAVLLTAGLAVSMWQSWWFIVFLIVMQWPSVRRSREDAQLLATLPPDAAQRPTPELDLLILTALQARLPAQSLKERLTRALSLRQTVRMQPLGLGEGLLVLALWLGLWAWAVWLAWQALHWVGMGGPLID